MAQREEYAEKHVTVKANKEIDANYEMVNSGTAVKNIEILKLRNNPTLVCE